VDAFSDEKLLAHVGDGDAAALEALYDRYQSTAMALAYRIFGERATAEEVVQEGFFSVWRRARTFEPARGSGKAWLLALMLNRAIDRLRRRRGAPQEQELETALEVGYAHAPDAFEVAYQALRRQQVRAALDGLPTEQRQAIELAYFGGFTQQEIAERTGAPLCTVKSRTRLAMLRLRELLDRELAVDS
jgi:RNA polymerase sigma-70 factor (ECF subfamily)